MNDSTDWYELQQVSDRGYMITEASNYNMYLLEGKDTNILLDTGIGIGNLDHFLKENGFINNKVILSHTHWDHIGCVDQFENIFVDEDEIHPSGDIKAPEYFCGRIPEVIDNLIEGDMQFPTEVCTNSYSYHDIPSTSNFSVFNDKTSICLGNRTVEIIELPGHSPGHIGILDPEEKCLYAADILGSKRRILSHFPNSNLKDYFHSINKLIRLKNSGKFSKLLTGHSQPIEDMEIDILSKVSSSIQEIIDGNFTRNYKTMTTGRAIVYPFKDYTIYTKPTFKPN